MTPRRGSPVRLDDVLEKTWDQQLFASQKGLAPSLGWTTYHVLRSRGSKAGYPDRTLCRERIVFAELKREKTKPTDEQTRWLTLLAKAGGEVYLWRPSDLDEIGVILGRRWMFRPGELFFAVTAEQRTNAWTPGSLWLPGGHRADGS